MLCPKYFKVIGLERGLITVNSGMIILSLGNMKYKETCQLLKYPESAGAINVSSYFENIYCALMFGSLIVKFKLKSSGNHTTF